MRSTQHHSVEKTFRMVKKQISQTLGAQQGDIKSLLLLDVNLTPSLSKWKTDVSHGLNFSERFMSMKRLASLMLQKTRGQDHS